MLRILGSILLGYLTMVVVIMATFTLWWLVLGQDTAFHAGTTQVTWAWLAGAMPMNLAAAAAGGAAAAWVARSREMGAVLGLMGLVLVLGVATALAQMSADPPAADALTAGTVSVFEAAARARQPLWVAWTLPLVGMTGAGLGGLWVMRKRAQRGRAIQEVQVDPAP